ncbi:hypothetical protein [uncultured Alsobacter sp.]|uniref:hypothetical protein n=1 Tax=uncultured Alsobacter sp. TaxID=1748258 RepID=UPI0025EE2DAA|nr:hypothetical protein [uncultured Alsobacter sp.]
MTTRLPDPPDFAALEAAAPATADRRSMILALIGNVVFSWSNNESMFIYVLMVLIETDDVSAAIIFATLNTTRARLDLVQRLAKVKVEDKATARALEELVERFNAATRLRNEFNHSMYTLDDKGEITHTSSTRVHETRKGGLQLGVSRAMNDERIREMVKAIEEMKSLNRDLWAFLPRLQAAVAARGARTRRPAQPPEAV